MSEEKQDFMHKVDKSAVFTVIGIILLFSSAVIVTLVAPGFIDTTWIQPSSAYQVQMYEVSDPNYYLSSMQSGGKDLQAVYHIKKDYTLLAFRESDTLRFVAPPELKTYITRSGDEQLKLTSRLLMLRPPQPGVQGEGFDAHAEAAAKRADLQEGWEREHPDWKEKGLQKPAFDILELFEPAGEDAFALAPVDNITENWADENYLLVDGQPKQPYHGDSGVIFVDNPQEYRITYFKRGEEEGWKFDPQGKPIQSLDELKSHSMGFRSRKELIELGEHTYQIEGCWYCHTDQTRTLIQDVVMNGSEEYPAPPSSANEYIYQRITFPGTKRNGPDLSRVGVKRPYRDWHQSHFWQPRTTSKGSIMPAFQHFFDTDPRGTSRRSTGIPNYKFEAVYQYLMTKGTRITPPTEAWWLGKDPVQTKEIIEGKKKAL